LIMPNLLWFIELRLPNILMTLITLKTFIMTKYSDHEC
jgi:hypothetical protein